MAEPVKEKENLKLSAGHNADWWVQEIVATRKASKDYRDKGKKVIERFRNKREQVDSSRKRFNILYSNTETLGPAVYSQVPVPDIRRRWADKDPVGRLSALVLQRSTQFCMEAYDFDGVLKSCRLDYLLPGFATARIRYKPHFKKTAKKDEAGNAVMGKDGQPAMDEELVYHEAQTEYVPWDRFIMSRSRQWPRVWYVGFGDDLTKDEVEEQFGPKVAGALKYNRRNDSSGIEKEDHEATARLWEIWCRRGRSRFIVAEGYDDWVVKPEADPLRLENFFPCPKPLWSIQTNDTLEPVPEYLEYEDQALELDDLTERIDVLTSALRRRGVYDAEFADLKSMLANQNDNAFVPINNFAAFMAKGGLEKLALEMPLDGLIKAIVALEDRRELVKQVIYEVTGIADIVRGSSNPNETLGAQELKGKWAGLRISVRQSDFAKFARDLVRLKAEVIAERFDAQTLSLISGIKLPMQAEKEKWTAEQQAIQQQQQQYQRMAQQAQQAGQQPPPPPQLPQPTPEEQKFYAQPTWEQILAVLHSDKLRGYKIDIETDSTVQPDADGEKNARNELLTAVGNFVRSLGVPIPPQLAAQLINFTVRSYKVGSQMEQELEALEQNNGPTPQQQQKEKELQEREAKVKQAEEGAKDATHKAQIAEKDTQAAADKLKYDEQVFKLRQELADEVLKMQEQVQQIREQFEERAFQAMQTAEGVVRDVVGNPQGVPQ